MVGTITQKTKGKARTKSEDAALARIKEGRELVPLIVGSYVVKNLYNNVTCI
jgi:hypothetical protein